MMSIQGCAGQRSVGTQERAVLVTIPGWFPLNRPPIESRAWRQGRVPGGVDWTRGVTEAHGGSGIGAQAASGQ